MNEHLSRLIEDQPCTCFSPEHKFWCAKRTADLVPGYADSADGKADASDQRRMDGRR